MAGPPTEGAPAPAGDDAHAPERAAAAAGELLRRGRPQQAAARCTQALALLDAQPAEAHVAQAALRRELLVSHADALLQCGELSRALALLQQHLPPPGAAAAAAVDTVLARAWRLQGQLLLLLRRNEEARALLQAALDALPAGDGKGAPWRAERARLVGRLAISLGASARLEEAMALHEQAVALLEDDPQAELHAELAVALANRGASRWLRGDLATAQADLARALALHQGLADGGNPQARRMLALTRMNLAGAILAAGSSAEAQRLYAQAAAGYDSEIQRAQRCGGDVARLRASRAQTEMNWAYSLFQGGDYDAAARRYRSARRRYAALALVAPQLRDDEARTWVNQAHLLARQRRAAAAARLYARGLKAFDALIAQGRGHLAADAANARLGLARAQALQGRGSAAASHFQAAQAALVALAAQGQLQHARSWLGALCGHVDALLDGGCAAAADARGLLQALAQPPRGAQYDIAARCSEIDAALDHLDGWSARCAAAPWLADVACALLGHLLDLAALLLGEAEPEALRQHAEACRRLVTRLGGAARAWPQEPQLLADWFLHTRGLRAQRSALAEGRDRRLLALRDDLARLRRLEEELLAQPATAADATRAASWRELHARCETQREALVQAGLLPPLLRLQARTLAAQMPRQGALLMLAQGGPGELLAIALHRPDAAGCTVQARVLRLDAGAAALDCAGAYRRLRLALRPWCGGQAVRRSADSASLDAAEAAAPPLAQAEREVHEAHRQLAESVLQPMLEALAARGLNEIALVPSGDLHLLPYHELLGDALAACGSRLAVYPSAGAWARCTVLAPARRGAGPALRWALAAQGTPGADAPLHWVVIEQGLSERLWAAAGGDRITVLDAAAPRARGVNALLGMGHGHAPAGNVARAGLLLGPGQVLGGHDLPAIRTCHHVLLSCCVLGRIDEVHSETMGFLSSSFGYRCRFGAGWLVEVPDAEACLFSLAFQHALREAEAARPRAGPAWGEVFESVRRGIRDGAWPRDFGAWLGQALPAVIAESGLAPGRWLNRYEYLRDFDGGLFAVPPPSLRRLVPWVVALGR